MMDLKKYDEILGQPIEMGSVIAVGRDDMIDIITRLRQAEKDAARYRWLRDESWGCDKDISAPKVMYGRMNQKVMLAENAMDAAIDEAMQCSK